MKMVVFLLAILTIGVVPQVGSAKGVRLREEFTMRIGQRVKVSGTHLRIDFVDVLDDTRCPSDVQCISAGNAALNLELRWKSRPPNSVLVNTTSGPAQAEIRRFVVKLVRLVPNPVAGQSIDKADYLAALLVTEDDDPDHQ
ncbi:MAG TPA: hypothetical protein VLM38_14040 [Blastocatellia bacterium]|nr:hypothetical protein [Blastocatellia bacterium]